MTERKTGKGDFNNLDKASRDSESRPTGMRRFGAGLLKEVRYWITRSAAGN